MRKNDTMKMSLCGITAAMCIVILMMGFMFPFATYACPAAAAMLLMPVAYEYRQKTAFTLYIAVSFLGVMLVPEPELICMFIFVFGFYTVIKFSVDRIINKTLRFLIKLGYINATLALTYSLLLIIFPVTALVNEFREYGIAFIALLMVMFNLTFFLYDKAAEKLLMIYVYRFRPKLFRHK